MYIVQTRTSKLVFFQLVFVLLLSAIKATDANDSPEHKTISRGSWSSQRILNDDTERDKMLLFLTANDKLVAEIINNNSLIVGTEGVMVCRRAVYAWFVNHISVSAKLAYICGRHYYVTPGSVYEYHGEDENGLLVDFYRAFQDSVSTVFVGDGEIKLFHFYISGSFINFMEYYDMNKSMARQSCMYVKFNNPVVHFFANLIFLIPNTKRVIIEKLFNLDDTVNKMVTIFMEDPHFYRMLQRPEASAPDEASEVAVRMKNAVLKNTSPEETIKLGQLIEMARMEVEYK